VVFNQIVASVLHGVERTGYQFSKKKETEPKYCTPRIKVSVGK
jgi:hypothetical protein